MHNALYCFAQVSRMVLSRIILSKQQQDQNLTICFLLNSDVKEVAKSFITGTGLCFSLYTVRLYCLQVSY